MMVHIFNSSTPEVVAGRVWGQPDLYIEFQASQVYMVKPYLKKLLNC